MQGNISPLIPSLPTLGLASNPNLSYNYAGLARESLEHSP